MTDAATAAIVGAEQSKFGSVLSTHHGSDFHRRLEAVLTEFLARRRAEASVVGPIVDHAAGELERYVLAGGKRTRPSFVWAAWLGARGERYSDSEGSAKADVVLKYCAALELLHASALIHDDIIDRSDARRGRASVHVTFAAEHQHRHWSGDRDHFGVGAAILIGDLAAAWADDLVHEADTPVGIRHRTDAVWAAMRTEVLGGQLLDIAGEASREESVDAAMRINRYKTASYTAERPLHLGASLAAADEALIADYRCLGTDIGMAFQLRDDLLGVFGDPAVTGKPSGDDLRTGKRTVLLIEALARVNTKDRGASRLRTAIGTDLSAAEIDELRQIILSTGAVSIVERKITELTDRALRTLERAVTDRQTRAHMHSLIVAACGRDR